MLKNAVFLFIGKNNTTQQYIQKKNKLSKQDVDELCDANGDYEAHKKQLDKLYDGLEEDD